MAPPSAINTPSISDTQVATFSGPLSVNGVSTRRAKAPKMPGGLAPHASSDMFKSPVRHGGRFYSAATNCYTKPNLGLRQAEG